MSASAVGATLQIRFAQGERPWVFWVSRWERGPAQATRYKVLTKSCPDRTIEVLVIEEEISGRRRGVARERVGTDRPSGWLAHWVTELAQSLGTEFAEFDLRTVQSRAEWQRVARRLGWTLDAQEAEA